MTDMTDMTDITNKTDMTDVTDINDMADWFTITNMQFYPLDTWLCKQQDIFGME